MYVYLLVNTFRIILYDIYLSELSSFLTIAFLYSISKESITFVPISILLANFCVTVTKMMKWNTSKQIR